MAKLIILIAIISLAIATIQLIFTKKITQIENLINQNMEWENANFTFTMLSNLILILTAVLLLFISTNYTLH